jgi:antitoxin component HigA of HigAB toxin-antitoxin module
MAPEFSVTQIIESFMEDHGMTQSDLGRTLGDRTLGHKILTGKRQLTVPQIKTLAETFKVSPELFM